LRSEDTGLRHRSEKSPDGAWRALAAERHDPLVFSRPLWFVACVITWPIYYLVLLVEWFLGPVTELALWRRWWDYELDLYKRFRSPPFIKRVRYGSRR
jgi:hypothetical protein